MKNLNQRSTEVVVYGMKRRYGQVGYYFRVLDSTRNLQTGVITKNEQEIKIKRMVVAPAKQTREFSYDLSYIAANKNFTYGGFFDINQRIIIIDAKDLPKDFEPNLNDYIVFNKRRYEVQEMGSTTEGIAYLFLVKAIMSSDKVL